MQIETIAVDRLIPYARNSRTHSDAQVAQIVASIREYGFTNPVLIDGEGGIIAGHGRTLAARQMGLAEVPCLRLPHLTENQKRAYIIADNKLALNAGWNDEMLALELRELGEAGYDVGLTGFELSEIDELLATLDATPEGKTDPDATPPVQAEAVSKLGDVWVLGKHRVMCADSSKIENVKIALNGEVAQFIITDPPYSEKTHGNAKSNRGVGHENKAINFSSIGFDEIRNFLKVAAAVSRGWVVANMDWRHIAQIEFDGDDFYELVRFGVWVKTNPMPQISADRPANGWDGIAYLYPKDSKKTWNGGGRHGNWIGPVVTNGDHPTGKPVEMVSEWMQRFGNAGGICFDPFSGSGTTIIAAEQTGRRCYAMELSPQYVDVAVRRWQQFTGKRAVLESTGAAFPD